MNNSITQKSFFYIMLLIMVLSITVPGIRLMLSADPQASNGTLDLRQYDLTQAKTVKLNGEWEFYFGQLLTPTDFKNGQPMGKTIQKVPGSWSSYQIADEQLPPHGCATYRLKILLPEGRGNYGIKFTTISAAARIFADDVQIMECGRPGNLRSTTVHKSYADASYFQTDDDEVEILIQAADFANVKSGILYEIHFGSQNSIAALRLHNSFLDISVIAGMFFLSLYFFGLGLRRRNGAAVLFLAFYCLFSALHASVRSEALLNYAFPSLAFNTSAKILATSYTICLYTLIKFLYHALAGSFSRRANLITNGIAVVFLLLSCFTYSHLLGYTLAIVLIGHIYALSLIIVILAKSSQGDNEGRYYLYTAVLSSLIALLTGLANIILLWESNLFFPVFQPIFVLSLALYMSEKYRQIFVPSRTGQGTAFTFPMPLAKEGNLFQTSPANFAEQNASQSLIVEPLPQTVHIGGEFSILAVDDEFSNLKAIMNILTANQYNVTVAGNGESALQLLKGALNYDLCILDVTMPGMSGYEVCRKIRETYSPLELPILLLSAKALPEDIDIGFRAGANDFIEKPFEAGELKCRVRTLVQLKSSMDLLVKKETAFLQAQIRPHFLFNALNTIHSFCYTDPDKAGDLLAELGVFLRNSFDFSSTTSVITIEKELRIVKAYVAIEQARFGKQLEVEYAIDHSVLNFYILPLMLQPIVENSIRHGLLKRSKGGKVTLSLELWKDQIYVQVIDNGAGIPAFVLEDLTNSKPEGKGVGLSNINRRLLRFYGTTLNISSTENCGTTVSFKIPAKTC